MSKLVTTQYNIYDRVGMNFSLVFSLFANLLILHNFISFRIEKYSSKNTKFNVS